MNYTLYLSTKYQLYLKSCFFILWTPSTPAYCRVGRMRLCILSRPEACGKVDKKNLTPFGRAMKLRTEHDGVVEVVIQTGLDFLKH